jgi:hypothetical protein
MKDLYIYDMRGNILYYHLPDAIKVKKKFNKSEEETEEEIEEIILFNDDDDDDEFEYLFVYIGKNDYNSIIRGYLNSHSSRDYVFYYYEENYDWVQISTFGLE